MGPTGEKKSLKTIKHLSFLIAHLIDAQPSDRLFYDAITGVYHKFNFTEVTQN